MAVLIFSGDSVAYFGTMTDLGTATEFTGIDAPFLATDTVEIEIADTGIGADGEFDPALVEFSRVSVIRDGVRYDFGVTPGSRVAETGGVETVAQGDSFFTTTDVVAPPASGPFAGLSTGQLVFATGSIFATGVDATIERTQARDLNADGDTADAGEAANATYNVTQNLSDGIVSGTAGNDTIDVNYTGDPEGDRVTTGNDSMSGGGGEDLFRLGATWGVDTIDGGSGTDTLDFTAASAPVTVTFTSSGAGTATDGTNTVTFSGIEAILGSAFADTFDASADTAGTDIDGGTGNDTITGGSGNDTILGGDGNDSIEAGDGQDLILGGSGEDYINTGAGNDTVDAGDGNDIITVTDDHGVDSIDGGGWYDQLVFANFLSIQGISVTWSGDGAGSYDFFGTAGAGTFAGIEQSSGTAYADVYDASADTAGTTIYAAGGNDSLTGGSGNDRLFGDQGADMLDGGAGGDTLSGGSGNDIITGGAGDDVFVYAAGDGHDTITDFNTGNGGTLSDGISGNNDSIDLSAFYDKIWELHADQADDGILNQSNSATADYSDNTLFGSGSLTFTGASADGSFFTVENTGVVCFAAGTMILTPAGEVPVESLRPGDRVVTRDDGPQPVLWIGSRDVGREELARRPNLRPVVLAPRLTGGDRPLRVSPQHCLLLTLAAGEERLVRATHLARLRGGMARVAQGCRSVTYLHLMFARHQIVYSNGVPSESFYPGPEALRSLAPEAARQLATVMPALFRENPAAYGPRARPIAGFRSLPRRIDGLSAPGAGDPTGRGGLAVRDMQDGPPPVRTRADVAEIDRAAAPVHRVFARRRPGGLRSLEAMRG